MPMASDPADKALDAQADGNFGGKHESTGSHRSGYTNPLQMALTVARKGGTLGAGEGLLIIKYYEERLADMQQEIDGLTHEFREQARELTRRDHYDAAF